MNDSIDENVPSIRILFIISFSDNGPLASMSLTNVAGARLSLDATNL